MKQLVQFQVVSVGDGTSLSLSVDLTRHIKFYGVDPQTPSAVHSFSGPLVSPPGSTPVWPTTTTGCTVSGKVVTWAFDIAPPLDTPGTFTVGLLF